MSWIESLRERFVPMSPVPPTTEDEEALFDAYLATLVLRIFQTATFFGTLIILVFWPFDTVVLSPETATAYVSVRIVLISLSLAGFLLHRYVLRPDRAGVILVGACVTLYVTAIGWVLAPLGLVGLQYLSPMPLLAVAFPTGLPARASLAFSLALCPWAAALYVHGGVLPADTAGTFATAIGAAALAIFFGGWLVAVLRVRHVGEQRLAGLKAHLEDRVAEQSGHLRALARELLVARDSERRWLSQELHDALGQDLTALRHAGDLSALQLRRGLIEDAEVSVEDIGTLVERTHATLRRILARMRPEAVEQLGLVEGLRTLVEDASRRGVTARLDVGTCAIPDLPASIADTLYRVAQEALTNVLRHAKARSVDVALSCDDREVALTVTDDGVGLPATASAGEVHVGLIGIRERALARGGRATWSRPPGGGLRVSVSLPRLAN